jgi:two-component system response regulator RegA
MTHILIVDDDTAFTQVLSRALQRRKFGTSIANSCEHAIDIAQSQNFNKAIIDLKMEGPTGLSLIPQLKRLQPTIEIVMLTGYSSVATAVEAVKLGAVNYLCKPANTEEILAAFANKTGDPLIEISEQRPSVDRVEWEHIQKVLAENSGNISATARLLGMHRRTLQRKLNKKPVKQ